MAKKFNDPSIATITILNDADMMSTFNASTGELNKILVSNVKASIDTNFANADLTADANRAHDFGAHDLHINNLNEFQANVGDPDTTDYAQAVVKTHNAYFSAQDGDSGGDIQITTASGVALDAYDATHQMYFILQPAANQIKLLAGDSITDIIIAGGASIRFKNTDAGFSAIIPTIAADNYIPLSVNGTFADSAGNITLVGIADDFLNDAAAATGGIAVGGLYHTSGVVKIRLS